MLRTLALLSSAASALLIHLPEHGLECVHVSTEIPKKDALIGSYQVTGEVEGVHAFVMGVGSSAQLFTSFDPSGKISVGRLDGVDVYKLCFTSTSSTSQTVSFTLRWASHDEAALHSGQLSSRGGGMAAQMQAENDKNAPHRPAKEEHAERVKEVLMKLPGRLRDALDAQTHSLARDQVHREYAAQASGAVAWWIGIEVFASICFASLQWWWLKSQIDRRTFL